MSAIAHIAGRAIDAILHPIIRRALEPITRRVDELERELAADTNLRAAYTFDRDVHERPLAAATRACAQRHRVNR
jgi:hypothetical protein